MYQKRRMLKRELEQATVVGGNKQASGFARTEGDVEGTTCKQSICLNLIGLSESPKVEEMLRNVNAYGCILIVEVYNAKHYLIAQATNKGKLLARIEVGIAKVGVHKVVHLTFAESSL